jgi:hypothetical protein
VWVWRHGTQASIAQTFAGLAMDDGHVPVQQASVFSQVHYAFCFRINCISPLVFGKVLGHILAERLNQHKRRCVVIVKRIACNCQTFTKSSMLTNYAIIAGQLPRL